MTISSRTIAVAKRAAESLLPGEDPRGDALLSHVGFEVTLVRGARGRFTGPGRERRVAGRLDAVGHNIVHATLLQDDPDATTPPMRAGEEGAWPGWSFLELPPEGTVLSYFDRALRWAGASERDRETERERGRSQNMRHG